MSHFSIALQIALRARFGWLAGSTALVLIISTILSSQFSGRQSATVAMDIGLSVIRLAVPLTLIIIAQELISKDFERRYFLNTLSYPSPRHNFLLNRYAALATLTIGLLIGLSFLLAVCVWLISKGYQQSTPIALGVPFLSTIIFFALEIFLLNAIAVFIAVTASTPSFVLIGTSGFMVIARSFSPVIELLKGSATAAFSTDGYRTGVGLLGYLLPDLGALDIRMVALYGRMEFLPSNWPLLILSTVSYTIGILSLAVWALQRKRIA
ncbi:hypothetical protein [Stutzerimonas stutzeri]|uniref:hypothetical protein n=1 Tax=Stutzerimonas stutzeri TaxID=316 RepID=UPI001F510B73|nr:hypothetical protein [Stutzerimonas stutzeri]WRQ03986.1 hypothetical protein U3Q39_004775 [Stutzerimonas stutzeri]